ncbi:MAG: hypothetical protein E4G95_05095, partial [Bacteroidia bacterium]
MRRAPNSELYKFPSEKSKGIVGTVIFHIAVLAIILVSGFHTPLPMPEEEGILVNFGYDETGSGILEPSAASGELSAADPAAEEAVPQVNEEVSNEQATLTQEFEEAPEVVKQAVKPDPEAERRKQQAIEEERIRQQQLEAERVKKANEEAERKRIQEEKDRLAREAAEQETRRNNIFNRTLNALNNSNAAGTGTGSNQGVAGDTGNQGVKTGAVNSNVYGEGSGTGTRGISFDLAGRTPTKLPNPTYDIQSDGIVVVEVTVDRNGNVTQAVAGVKGSTTLEDYFLRVAKEAALAAKFDAKPDAPTFQKGYYNLSLYPEIKTAWQLKQFNQPVNNSEQLKGCNQYCCQQYPSYKFRTPANG